MSNLWLNAVMKYFQRNTVLWAVQVIFDIAVVIALVALFLVKNL
jgi:hypothetical protein